MDALIWGFLLGIVASAIAWLISEKWAQAKPIICLDSQRFMGQTAEGGHEFFHVVVRNAKAWWPINVRRPAWACEARITVVEPVEALGASPTLIARWASQPEPVSPTDRGLVLDPGKMIISRRMDVHSHHDERIGVLLKHEGDADCYLFSNESYHFPNWKKSCLAIARRSVPTAHHCSA